MRDRLRRFVVGSCQKDGTYFNGFSRKPTVATVSKICGFYGISGSYSPQGFTTRQITGNLPIAGRSTKGLFSLPFSFISMLLKFLWNGGKNYWSFSHEKAVKLIKTDRNSAQRICKLIALKQLRFAVREKVSITKLRINWVNHLELLLVTAH